MTFPKLLAITACLLFTAIAAAAWMKQEQTQGKKTLLGTSKCIDIPALSNETNQIASDSASTWHQQLKEQKDGSTLTPLSCEGLPRANRIEGLFYRGEPKLPIVETIPYQSRVSWMKGRPAWLADYATHYDTSRHFIARSLNGSTDYITQNINNGDNINVFRQDKNFHFYLLVDSSRCMMWFYYVDEITNEHVLLKQYPVGLGRVAAHRASGLLTPKGKYKLGSKVAVYKTNSMGYYQGERSEMIQTFGTRWIPFEKEVAHCSEPAKGFGIHGVPWDQSNSDGQMVERENSVLTYESDGCIRLRTDDVEELFAIIVTKPTYIEIVKDFYDADIPSEESSISMEFPANL
jgi:uncharacterized protein YgiM (DUF1202 family)